MSYFKDDEFMCKCGCDLDIAVGFKRIVAEARELAGIPFVITSGARCKEYNEKIGGKEDSSHTRSLAVDIACTDSRSRSIIMNAFCLVGINRVGIAKTFLHFDIDGSKDPKVTWLYS